MEITVDLKNLEQFITSDKFTQFLLNNTTDFGTAAFILDILTRKVEELKNQEKD